MLIHEFHSQLDLRHDQGTLFDALHRLRLMTDLKSADDDMAGWIVWTDDTTQDPDGGGSLRLALAMA